MSVQTPIAFLAVNFNRLHVHLFNTMRNPVFVVRVAKHLKAHSCSPGDGFNEQSGMSDTFHTDSNQERVIMCTLERSL